jgi:alpha-mannosidase
MTDGAFEVVERPVGVPAYDESWIEQPRPEVPQRAFTDVSDGRHGLMIANRGLPEVQILKNSAGNAEIALTLLRCVGWLSRDDFSTRKGHAGPATETPGAQLPGKWTFNYAILPHAGDWQAAAGLAYAFESPLRAAATGIHNGNLPAGSSFVTVEPLAFVVSAVRESQDGRGWVLRGYNLTGENIQVTLKPWRKFARTALVNLAEDIQAGLSPDEDGTLHFKARGHQIVTLRFEK